MKKEKQKIQYFAIFKWHVCGIKQILIYALQFKNTEKEEKGERGGEGREREERRKEKNQIQKINSSWDKHLPHYLTRIAYDKLHSPLIEN